MTPLNLSETAGDTWVITFTFSVAQTGSTWASQVRDEADALVVEFDCTYDPETLVVTMTAAAEETQVDPGSYRWDLQRTVSGAVKTLLGGRFTVEADVTR